MLCYMKIGKNNNKKLTIFLKIGSVLINVFTMLERSEMISLGEHSSRLNKGESLK